MDDRAIDAALATGGAAIFRASDTFSGIIAIMRASTEANNVTAERLDQAAAQGRMDTSDVVEDLAEIQGGLNARLAPLAAQLTDDVHDIDAAIGTALDGLETRTERPDVRHVLRSVGVVGAESEFLSKVIDIAGMESLDETNPILAEVARERAVSLHAVIASCAALAKLGARARAADPYQD